MFKVISFMIMFILIACGKEQEQIKVMSDTTSHAQGSSSNTKIFNIETNVNVKDNSSESNNNFKTIPGKSLAKVLPASIPGTNQTAFKFGNLLENNINITSVSREYLFSNNAHIQILITDYYNYENIPKLDKSPFEKDLKLLGKSYRKFTIKNNKCYVVEDNYLKESVLAVLYQNRIIIKMESFNLDIEKLKIDNFLRYINFNYLDSLVNKYK